MVYGGNSVQAEGMIALASKALASGGQLVAPTRIEWDMSGNCTAPVGRDISYRQPKQSLGTRRDYAWGVEWRRKHTVEKPFNQSPLHMGLVVGMTLRCRRCDNCRNGRKWLWTQRARTETGGSYRTWFGTITLSPQSQFRFLTLARAKLSKQGVDFDGEDFGAQHRLRVSAISPEITKYLKRVRKASGAPLRFLMVSEVHKSGEPHFHMLVHETDHDAQVTHRILSDHWKWGFTKWNLVKDAKSASYLTKYLAKSSAARVRASLRYGTNDLSIIDNRR